MRSHAYRKRSPQIDSQRSRDASQKIEMTEGETRVKKSSHTEVICAELRTNPSEERTGRNHSPLPLIMTKTPKRRVKKTKSKRSQNIEMIVILILRLKLAS